MIRTSETATRDTDQTQYVAHIFNEMADEYDNLKDPWYSYAFGEIERVLRRHFRPNPIAQSRPLALDIGCGTGIQSLILAELGYYVEGMDIADDLITIAETKLRTAGFTNAHFQHADAKNLPFEDCIADVINCCGPTLSFVPEWRTALQEISRCLKPGGKLLLEVEGKWTLDMLWEVLNALIGNRLGYDKSLKKALKQFLPPWSVGHCIDYSFVLESGDTVTMPLKLFTARELNHELEVVDLLVQNRWGLHFLTNLLPSTVLHHADAGPLVRSIFRQLAGLERLVYSSWPFNALACSLLIMAKKRE
jgi:ubiquinone/menaquinone biosynthesis C-methylase UbiE